MCPQERVCRGSGITINNCHMVVNTHFTVEPLWGNQLCAWAGRIAGVAESVRAWFPVTGLGPCALSPQALRPQALGRSPHRPARGGTLWAPQFCVPV